MANRFSKITIDHFKQAAYKIDRTGYDLKHLGYHYIKLNDKEYPFKYLSHKAYEECHGEGSSKDLNWQYDPNNDKIIGDLGLQIKHYSEKINPIMLDELEFFASIAGTKFDSKSSDGQNAATKLKLLVKKLNYLASKSIFEKIEYDNDNSWQWSGRVFKKYLWVKAYDRNCSGKIFFNFGINENGRIYLQLNKLDTKVYHIEPLTDFETKLYTKYLNGVGYKEQVVPESIIKASKWSLMISYCQSFVQSHFAHYYELENHLFGDLDSSQKGLVKEKSPDSIKSRIPNKRKFKGRKTNWSELYKTSNQIGLSGEQLVVDAEKSYLIENNKIKLANNVAKKLDGEGFDIISYNLDETEKYIEVKSTTGGKTEPFYLTLNEKEFAEQHAKSYQIYRVYNLNLVDGSGKYFIIDGIDLPNFDLSPIVFEVSLENKKSKK